VTLQHESRFEQSLQRDIALLCSKVQEMAALGEGGLRNSMKALMNRDRQLAYTVILRDRCIDELEIELDRLCLEFIVRQQPVAGHLRFVFATIKIIRELERIGDYAESISRQVLRIIPSDPIPPLDDFNELAELAIPMFHQSVKAFLEKDVDLARSLMVIEDQADLVRSRINGKLLNHREVGELAMEAFAPLMTIARRLERTSDQAKNICEEVIYMTTGEFVKHQRRESFRILFVDADNSCLSPMAGQIGVEFFSDKFIFDSAGITPAVHFDPLMMQFMATRGHPVSKKNPQRFDDYFERQEIQVIVDLGVNIRKELPEKVEKAVVFEWPMEDPSKRAGTAAEIHAAYEQSYSTLVYQLQDLVQAILGHAEFRAKNKTAP